jgi:hypothetical protein
MAPLAGYICTAQKSVKCFFAMQHKPRKDRKECALTGLPIYLPVTLDRQYRAAKTGWFH